VAPPPINAPALGGVVPPCCCPMPTGHPSSGARRRDWPTGTARPVVNLNECDGVASTGTQDRAMVLGSPGTFGRCLAESAVVDWRQAARCRGGCDLQCRTSRRKERWPRRAGDGNRRRGEAHLHLRAARAPLGRGRDHHRAVRDGGRAGPCAGAGRRAGDRGGTGGPKTPDLTSGKAATLEVGTVTKSMTGECSIPGHKEAGMTFEVRVGGAAATAEATPKGPTRPRTATPSSTPTPPRRPPGNP
jgi:hypothetical protein